MILFGLGIAFSIWALVAIIVGVVMSHLRAGASGMFITIFWPIVFTYWWIRSLADRL
jgi:hypothetical protein